MADVTEFVVIDSKNVALPALTELIADQVRQIRQNQRIPIVLWSTLMCEKIEVNVELRKQLETAPWSFEKDYDSSKITWIVIRIPNFNLHGELREQFNSNSIVASFNANVGAVAIQFAPNLESGQWTIVNNWLNSMSATLAMITNGASSMRNTSHGYSFWFKSKD